MPIIILIGPPGSGKSTVGKNLGKHMHLTFADTDTLIEALEGRKITDIFIDEGESYFRKKEEEVVLQALESATDILALGGGSVLSPKVEEALEKDQATIFYLQVSLSQAAPRVGFNRDRPLLLGNPRRKWQELMEKRAPIYERIADQIISTDSKKPQEVAAEIMDILKAAS